VETFTVREAAELTGLGLQALRSRVDRGQIRAVSPGRGKARRIPRAELESAGLSVEPRPAATSDVVSKLLATLETQAAELASLRQIEENAGSLAAAVEAEKKNRELAEQEIHRLRAHLEQVKTAPFWQRRKLLNQSSD
jgi:excisionase family DNA binding protein